MQKFKFSPEQLSYSRKPGISAFMRIKNGADFLEITIRSHLPYFDEIVACYNDCSDDTAAILQRLANEFPEKLRIFHYIPRVYPVLGKQHQQTSTHSLHSMANYYNFTLAKCRFQIAVKLDDDHLPISCALEAAVSKIRSDLLVGKKRLYSFSGINLAGTVADPQIYLNEAFVGSGDIMFFPIDPRLYFVQGAQFEELNCRAVKKIYPKCYLGLLYVHLKHLKPYYGFANLPDEIRQQYIEKFESNSITSSLAEFANQQSQLQLIEQYGRWSYGIRHTIAVRWLFSVLEKQQPLKYQRIARFHSDLALLNWQTDVVSWLLQIPQLVCKPASQHKIVAV